MICSSQICLSTFPQVPVHSWNSYHSFHVNITSVQPTVNLFQLITIIAPYSFDNNSGVNVPYHVGVHVNVTVYNLVDSVYTAV